MVDGKKIIGSAQLRKDGVILQQNSLPLAVDYPAWDEVFFRSDWQAVMREGMVDLWTAAGRETPEDEVVAVLREGFRSALGVDFTDSAFTPDEERRARELVPEYAVQVVTAGTAC